MNTSGEQQTRVAQAFKNITERRSNWYGHVMRRDDEHIPRKVLRADRPIPGKRKKGPPKSRRKDACQRDLKSRAYWTESGKDHQLYRRPHMMGKARGKVISPSHRRRGATAVCGACMT